MRIRFWGARGSIPVSGREYLAYGGDTTCVELRAADGTLVVVDAGSGVRALGNQLAADPQTPIHLLFTHAHWDHLLGFPFFKPLYHRSSVIHVYGCPCAQMSVQEMVSETMTPPNFPLRLKDTHAQMSYHTNGRGPFKLGSLTVTPVMLSHSNPAHGYKFVEAGRSFVFITDNELRYRHPEGGTFDDYVAFCAGADLLVHDAHFTPTEYERTRTWGHSTYQDAVDLALRADVKALGLFHHHPDHADDEVDRILATCRETLAREKAEIECFAVAQGTTREV